MSAAETEPTDAELPADDRESAPIVTKVIRTVMPGSRGHENTEMNAVGWTLFVGLVVLLVPFLALFVIA